MLAAGSAPSVQFPSDPRGRIAISSYSFREFIAGAGNKATHPTMGLKDFGAHVIEKFSVNKIEPWSEHFSSTDQSYLEQFRSTIERAGAAVANLAVDSPVSLYAADPTELQNAIAFTYKWIDVAVAVGSPSIRRNIARVKDAQPDLARLSESLRQITEHAEAKNVVVHLENDNPASEDPFFLVRLIRKVNSPWLHALPDFGNTLAAHDDSYSYRAIDAMFGHAYGICHVKGSISNDAGTVRQVDLARTFSILRKHAYKGYCSIEYDAPGDPYTPTARLIDATVKYLS